MQSNDGGGASNEDELQEKIKVGTYSFVEFYHIRMWGNNGNAAKFKITF